MREIGRDVGIEIFSVDVAICASNRQLSLKPFRATVIPRSSYLSFSRRLSRRRLSRARSLSLRCRHGPRATYMRRPACSSRAVHAREVCIVCVHVSRMGSEAESRSFTSFARSHIHALCRAKNCRRHIGCAGRARRKFLSCV